MSLTGGHSQQVIKILEKYPADHRRSAVMPLLHLVQKEKGYIDRHDIQEVARITGIEETEVASLIGFYSLYHDAGGGKLRIQVCVDLPCALRGAQEFLDGLCRELGIEPWGTTSDGLITVEPVMCLAACDKAPVFQTQGPEGIAYHENMTVEKTVELVNTLRLSSKEVKK